MNYRKVLLCALLSVSLGTVCAQNLVASFNILANGYALDDGNAGRGTTQQVQVCLGCALSTNTAEVYTWTQVGSSTNWNVCNKPLGTAQLCLSDNGRALIASVKSDTFAFVNAGNGLYYMRDTTTGRYAAPAGLGDGDGVITGTSAYPWTVDTVSSSAPPVQPTPSTKWVIMDVGDSTTLGANIPATFAAGGYKCYLYWNLQAYNPGQFSFIGNAYQEESPAANNYPPETVCAQNAWEGHGGYDIAGIQGVVDNDAILQNSKPNIILLLGGINNIVVDQNVGSITQQLTSFLADVQAKDPGALVIVSNLPPFNPNAANVGSLYSPGVMQAWANQVPVANAEIAAVVARFPNAILMDYYTADSANINANVGPDGLHPSVSGYVVLANLYYSTLSNAAKVAGLQAMSATEE